MSTSYDFVTGDTGSTLHVTCKDRDSGSPIALSGSTVRLKWKKADGTLATQVMTITDAPNGVAAYTFVAGELFSPKMRFEVEITDGTGKILTILNTIDVLVREQVG